jgi:GNAT superfamily N-acetyltransferase
MRIAPFSLDDADELAQLIRRTLQACNFEDYGRERVEEIAGKHSAAALIELSRRRQIVLCVGGARVVGTAALERNWIYAVFVAPEHQRAGIGTQLLQEIERIALEGHVTRLGVYSSVSTVSVYQRIGFV